MEGEQRAWLKGGWVKLSVWYITSRIWHKDLNGGGHSVGGFAGIIARVGGCGLRDNKLRLGLARAGYGHAFICHGRGRPRLVLAPTGGKDSDTSFHVVVDHAIVVIPKYIPKSEHYKGTAFKMIRKTYCGGAGAFSITHTSEIWDPRSMWYSSPPRMKASGLTTLKMTFREMVPVLVDTWIFKIRVHYKILIF